MGFEDGGQKAAGAPALRALAVSDLDAVQRLHAASFEALAAGHYTPAQVAGHSAYILAPAYRDLLMENRVAVAAEADGRIVATAGWEPYARRAGTARIRKVFVDPDRARRGLGRRMVEDAQARAAAAGLAEYFVRANLNAVPLYRHLGYRALEPGEMEVAAGVMLPVLYMERRGTPA